MATIREHFDTDPRICTAVDNVSIGVAPGIAPTTVTLKLQLDAEANAVYWSFFVPAGADVHSVTRALLTHPGIEACEMPRQQVAYATGFEGYKVNTNALVFTRRVLLYVDADLSATERNDLETMGDRLGFHVAVRDRGYAAIVTAHAHPLAFVSHDSSDKDTLVRELARLLTGLTCPVWYDEYSLKVGDNLRQSIERGLKESHRCILVLSPAFLANEGWGKAEYDSIFTRELLEKKNVILPVWHNVEKADVYAYSPLLANKVALKSSIGVEALAKTLALTIRSAAGLG